jgi:hypothetical protein
MPLQAAVVIPSLTQNCLLGSVPLLLLSERAVAFYQSVSSLTPYEDTLAEPVVWRR